MVVAEFNFNQKTKFLKCILPVLQTKPPKTLKLKLK